MIIPIELIAILLTGIGAGIVALIKMVITIDKKIKYIIVNPSTGEYYLPKIKEMDEKIENVKMEVNDIRKEIKEIWQDINEIKSMITQLKFETLQWYENITKIINDNKIIGK